MQRGAGGAKVPVHEHLVFKTELEAPFADHAGLDVHEFPVVGGLPEPDVEFQDWCGKAFGFHVGIACARHTEEFGTGLFKPHGVNGVVDDSHLVGFRIADFDMGGVLEGANFHALKI